MPKTINRASVEGLNRANIGKLPEHLGLVCHGVLVPRHPLEDLGAHRLDPHDRMGLRSEERRVGKECS